MDFGTLLHVAQKNEKMAKKEVKYYSTKFEPPKKEERASKQLSENIKRFLARKEAEEKQKALEAQIKKEELLALRAQDRKSTRRVAVMLKRTKSANKSVIQDAIDNNNTAVTLAGPSQPDEDDYGYVSQEASAYYNKFLAKFNEMPEEEKFPKATKKPVNVNLKEIREQVKNDIIREQQEALLPHKRKRKPKDVEETREYAEPSQEKPKSKSKPMPPPMNFNDLLKLAEKKQHEPIVIEPKVVPKDEERPMTKKQKIEFEKERAWREKKEKGLVNGITAKPEKINTNKIPKLSSDKNSQKLLTKPIPKKTDNVPVQIKKPEEKSNILKTPVKKVEEKSQFKKPEPKSQVDKSESNKIAALKAELERLRNENKVLAKYANADKSQQTKSVDKNKILVKKELTNKPKNLGPPKQFPPADLKPKQFPPPDIRKPKVLKQKLHKRRILDDEEYDSEMDDFIDDGPENPEDYSKYISEIFGYDKSKYRNEDYDDSTMESSFSQMMKEEFISSKIGLMEDLEDMKLEAEEKRRKAMMKKMKK